MAILDFDEALINRWISGVFGDGSRDELRARSAIADRLRHGPLSLGLRVSLANLIDPDMRDLTGLWLVFRRPRGNRSKMVDQRRVAAVVWHRVQAGDPMEAAYQHAAGSLGISVRSAKSAYAKWGYLLDRDVKKLKGLTRTD